MKRAVYTTVLLLMAVPAYIVVGPGAGAGLTALVLVVLAAPAQAYIGPGAGAGAILSAVAIVLGVLLLIVGFVWFPIRRKLRARKAQATEEIKQD